VNETSEAILQVEHAAIRLLIEAETKAFWNKDFEAWARCWVQERHVRRWGWWGSRGGITLRDGWEQQAERMQALMLANPKPNVSVAGVSRHKMTIRASGDLAWVTFDQSAPATGDGMDVAGVSHEMRVLERHEGEWKIAGLFFLQSSLDHLNAPAVRVDDRGRVLWRNELSMGELDGNEALAITGGRLRATDRPADQRLQAAIRWAARLDDGLYPTRGALPIVLDGGHGAPSTVCWVTGESGIVHVTINDRALTEERMTAAALVYGITPAQARLARLIINGDDVVSAAKRLGVSINTARTHLQRMYDRTGVRTQPALVRVLLSVARPFG